jgi:PPOX class probable F420-dependent enzyme
MSDPTPSRRLTGDEVLRDALVRELLEARLVAVLATFDSAGTIHAVPMWYAGDGDEVILATSSRSRKVRNLGHDPHATLVLHDSRSGYEVCGTSIAGTVAVVPPDRASALVELVHDRYVSAEGAADPAVKAYLESDDAALRFRPASALTWDDRQSDAALALRSRGGARPLVPTDPRD